MIPSVFVGHTDGVMLERDYCYTCNYTGNRWVVSYWYYNKHKEV